MRARVSLFLLCAALGALTAGCSDRICFQWGADEGPCPPASEADRFIQPPCDQRVTVDQSSEGEFEGDVCCYDADIEEVEFCSDF